LEQAKEKVVQEAEKWRYKLNRLEEELSVANDRVYNHKMKQREIVQKQINNATLNEQLMQNYIESLEDANAELSRELQCALSGKRASERQTAKARKIAAERLQKWHDERNKRKEAQDLAAKNEKAARDAEKLILEYKETTQDMRRQMQKEWADEDAAARRGGGRRWPIWVVQLICELLVNGTAPSSIPSNIETMYETLYGAKPKEVPSINFVRGCRVVVEIIGETIAAIKLAAAETWKQLWTDATTRRQISFTALVIGLLGDEENDAIDPVIVSSCIFMADERAETQADGIEHKIALLKRRLERLLNAVKERVPQKAALIPSPDGIDLNKLGFDGVAMTDTCNTAQKLRRILVDRIDGMIDLDCTNHLRNVWLGGVETSLTKYLNEILRLSLDEIDPMLRVSSSISALIRAIDKEFSLCANYPKGHGELFKAWMKANYSGALLLHVERSAGSRQDLCTEGCLAIYMNYPYYIEFLDEMLRKPKQSNQQASILQQNLFVVLTSTEMIALARLFSILHISICMPMSDTLPGKPMSSKCMVGVQLISLV
jgi:hypothetical protein